MTKVRPEPRSPRKRTSSAALAYRGHGWVGGDLPTTIEPWLRTHKERIEAPGAYDDEATREHVASYLRGKAWVWPAHRVYLFCDIHADAEAFVRSLVASGGVAKTGPGDTDYVLTAAGVEATFLVAGDCLDKGPSNLRLLRAVKHLVDLGADVVILAGNHDVRALVGMRCMGATDPKLAHLFVRMGRKAVPLFQEIADEYLRDADLETSIAAESRMHARMFPGDDWYQAFPAAVAGRIAPKKIEQELVRIREKTADMEKHCAKQNLSLVQVAAAVAKFHELFLTPNGEHAWLFERMVLAHRVGSLLFIHAGVDDQLASRLRTDGCDGINQTFKRLMADDLFELYHGAVGNGFRTKYRETDWPLTWRGVRDLHDAGVYAIAHGHRNILRGQRVIFREGMLNFECDASIDCNTRVLHHLRGPGAAVTIFQPDGRVIGISTDYPNAKLFDAATLGVVTVPCGNLAAGSRGASMDEHEEEGIDTEADDNEEESAMSDEQDHDGKVSFDAYMSRDEAVAYLEAIVKGMKSGALHFRRNDDELTLDLGPHLDIEVKASRKTKKQKLAIELSWRTETPTTFAID